LRFLVRQNDRNFLYVFVHNNKFYKNRCVLGKPEAVRKSQKREKSFSISGEIEKTACHPRKRPGIEKTPDCT
jgi:hypothetical protein